MLRFCRHVDTMKRNHPYRYLIAEYLFRCSYSSTPSMTDDGDISRTGHTDPVATSDHIARQKWAVNMGNSPLLHFSTALTSSASFNIGDDHVQTLQNRTAIVDNVLCCVSAVPQVMCQVGAGTCARDSRQREGAIGDPPIILYNRS